MSGIPLSPAAAMLVRALVARGSASADRILLCSARSTDWQSLLFNGERHCLDLRIAAPDAVTILGRLTDGLADAEFALRGQILADIALAGPPRRRPDGSILVQLEALTIAD